MVKIKVTTEVINRGGKSYIAKDWLIDVEVQDMEHFDGFAKFETKKVTPKKTKNDNKK